MAKSSSSVNRNKKLKIVLIVIAVILFLVVYGIEATKNTPPATQHSWIYTKNI